MLTVTGLVAQCDLLHKTELITVSLFDVSI